MNSDCGVLLFDREAGGGNGGNDPQWYPAGPGDAMTVPRTKYCMHCRCQVRMRPDCHMYSGCLMGVQ